MLQRWARKGEFYIGGFVNSLKRLRLRIARFIFALQRRNITLGGYLDTRRNIQNIYGTTVGLKYIYIYVYIYIYSEYLGH